MPALLFNIRTLDGTEQLVTSCDHIFGTLFRGCTSRFCFIYSVSCSLTLQYKIIIALASAGDINTVLFNRSARKVRESAARAAVARRREVAREVRRAIRMFSPSWLRALRYCKLRHGVAGSLNNRSSSRAVAIFLLLSIASQPKCSRRTRLMSGVPRKVLHDRRVAVSAIVINQVSRVYVYVHEGPVGAMTLADF